MILETHANNPILAAVLVPGYDFTRDTAGYASDLADIDQDTAAMLDQSGSYAGQTYQVVVLTRSLQLSSISTRLQC